MRSMDIVSRRSKDTEKEESQASSCPLPHSLLWREEVPRPTPRPFVVGVTGGTASGKTTCCEHILKSVKNARVATLSLDSYYKALSEAEIEQAHNMNYNFDHPDAFDWELLTEHLQDLSRGKTIKVPIYDFATHSRNKSLFETVHGSMTDILVLEGILIFYKDKIVDLMDMKVFVDTDSDIRLARRVKRDIAERGRDLEGVLFQYEKFVKPSFDQFILPSKKKADVVIPRGASNLVAMNLLVQHISMKLQERQQSTHKNPLI